MPPSFFTRLCRFSQITDFFFVAPTHLVLLRDLPFTLTLDGLLRGLGQTFQIRAQLHILV
jgi:hypothetical protein